MRRNRESRSRIKLIQEMHLTKEEQAYIGNALQKQKKRYTTAYTDYRNGMYFSYTKSRRITTVVEEIQELRR